MVQQGVHDGRRAALGPLNEQLNQYLQALFPRSLRSGPLNKDNLRAHVLLYRKANGCNTITPSMFRVGDVENHGLDGNEVKIHDCPSPLTQYSSRQPAAFTISDRHIDDVVATKHALVTIP